MVAAAAWQSAAVWPALRRAFAGQCGRCRARERDRAWIVSGRAVIWWSGPCRPAVLAACDPSIVEWVVCVTTSMFQDACWLCACVRREMRTYMCGSGSGVAAVTIAVDRETADASRSLDCSEKNMTCAYAPYEKNLLYDVEKCTVDLVLSSSTRTNVISTAALASKGGDFFLLRPLLSVSL